MENNKIKLVLVGKPTKILYQDYIVVAIGREHNLKFLSLDWQRRLHKNPHALEGGGLCLAGDVNAQNMRYVAVAVAEALRASTIVGRFLYDY
jgi:thioredoxin reductase